MVTLEFTKIVKRYKEGFSERLRRIVGLKPHLAYFELNLVDDCNMRCKGCSHFSPIAEKQFTRLEVYKRDLQQLSKLFSTIDTIRLLGGEPLLHPEIVSFLSFTRSCFPKANIDIVTNGVLLPTMHEGFWSACRKFSISIYVTIYPPSKGRESTFAQLADAKGVAVQTNSVSFFHAFFNSKGDTDVKAAFRKCRSRFYCPMLREGKLYVCCLSSNINIFNKYFGLEIPNTGFVDIYADGVTGWTIKERLQKASPTCSYCTLGWDSIPVFPWGLSTRTLEDYDSSGISDRSR
jgi:hypothetical protein